MNKILTFLISVILIFLFLGALVTFVGVICFVTVLKFVDFFIVALIVKRIFYLIFKGDRIRNPSYLQWPSLFEFFFMWIIYFYTNPYLVEFFMTRYIFPDWVHIHLYWYKKIQIYTEPVVCFMFLSMFILNIKQPYTKMIRSVFNKKDVYILPEGVYLVIGLGFLFETSKLMLKTFDNRRNVVYYELDENKEKVGDHIYLNFDSNKFIKTANYSAVQHIGVKAIEAVFKGFKGVDRIAFPYVFMGTFIFSLLGLIVRDEVDRYLPKYNSETQSEQIYQAPQQQNSQNQIQNKIPTADQAAAELRKLEEQNKFNNSHRSDTLGSVSPKKSNKELTIYRMESGYLDGKKINFIPHLIFESGEEAEKSLGMKRRSRDSDIPDLRITGYKADGSFLIFDRNDKEVDENGLFIIWFAYKGKIYANFSLNYPDENYPIGINKSGQNDKEISLTVPDHVYVVNGRKFNFDGSIYQ